MNRSGNEGFNGYQLKLNASMNMLVSLYVDPEYPDDYIPGFVRALGPRQVLIDAVSPYGKYDGNMVIRLSTIMMVLSEDDLAKRLKLLIDINGDPPPDPVETTEDEDLAHALLRCAMTRGRIVSVLTADADYAGLVYELDDMRVKLMTLDFFGAPYENVTIKLRDIDIVSMGAEEERMLEKLLINSAQEHDRGGEDK